ncbi:MAG TPA: ribonuclease [Sphingomicrobium sp.]|nr:ribonuclease [Sphingomicrobium sp.]
MPEWLIERGIGETRAALVDEGEIVEARVELDGAVPAGSVLGARLASVGVNGRKAIAVDERGAEYLLPRGAPGTTEGAAISIEVTREAILGGEPWKRPLAKLTDRAIETLPPLAERLGARTVAFPSATDALGALGWNDLIDEARMGVVAFADGELRISPTAAMTLVDVDGNLPPQELAVLGAGEAAKAIRRLDIGGSIGIDLPTAGSKAARQDAAAAIEAVVPQPFERTAVNGFGFIQVVRPRLRASLVELAQDRAAFEARALLRRAAFEPPGSKRLAAHPAEIAVLQGRKDWIDALARQVGGAIELRGDPSLPMSSGYAEAL